LQEFLEHGESFSYREQGLREEFLDCCTEPDGEAMMTVGPWKGPPRAGYFVNNLSVMDEFNADFKRARSTEAKVDKAGEIVRDENGNPVEVTLRHEDPTGRAQPDQRRPAPEPRRQVFHVALRAADFRDALRGIQKEDLVLLP
jgi:hypothetical protein